MFLLFGKNGKELLANQRVNKLVSPRVSTTQAKIRDKGLQSWKKMLEVFPE